MTTPGRLSLFNAHDDPEVESQRKEVIVLVTGYGPFLDKFPVNASWSIASTLPSYLPPTASLPIPIRVVVPPEPLRVSYSHVASVDPKLLSGTYSPTSPSQSPDTTPLSTTESLDFLPVPDVVLHIGLAAGRDYYTLERQSRGGYFDRLKDVDGHVFPAEDAQKLFSSCPEILKPTFDTEDVWRRWRTYVIDSTADLRPSDDPGIYLCGFIYYVSMAWYWKRNMGMMGTSSNKDRPVVFLHVPDLPSESETEQGRQVTIGLIKALVASRDKVGMVEPLVSEHGAEILDQPSRMSSEGSLTKRWDGVSDFPEGPSAV